MLLTEPFFKTFTKREVRNTSTHTEALIALSCGSRGRGGRNGEGSGRCGRKARDGIPWITASCTGWSFYDLDGHNWEPLLDGPKGDS